MAIKQMADVCIRALRNIKIDKFKCHNLPARLARTGIWMSKILTISGFKAPRQKLAAMAQAFGVDAVADAGG